MAESKRHKEAREYAEAQLVSAVLRVKRDDRLGGPVRPTQAVIDWAPVVLALNASTEVDDDEVT